ncbi:MAG: MFS transporter [Planktomarina sp.]|nr:MFS transporter [Planktomarina sp.]
MRATLTILTFAYVLSQFYRAFLAVLAAPLQADIGATAAQLSAASGYWFLTFALMQIPVGWALDTLGPRRTNAALLALGAGGGAVVFAAATEPWHISAAMTMIGIGCSSVLMAAYYVVARTFPAATFATMAAFILGIGSVGNIGAAFPLTLLVEILGWRMSIFIIALITLVIAALCYVIVKDPPKVETDEKGSLLDLLRMRAIWFILPMMLVSYAPSAGLRGLWVGPYFTDVFGASTAQVGTVTTLMALAMIAGTFCYGPLDRLLGTRKWVIFTGNLIGGLLCLVLYLHGDAEFWSTAAIMTGIGFFGASFPILIAHGRSFFPDHLMGRGVTLINLFGIGGVGIMQNVTTRVFDSKITQSQAPIASYNAVILVFCVTLLLGLVIYIFSQDRTD